MRFSRDSEQIRRILCIRNYFKPNIDRKIINTNLYCLIYKSFGRVKRWDYIHVFHQYQKLVLLEKLSGLDWVFCRISYNFKNIRGIIYYFLLLII